MHVIIVELNGIYPVISYVLLDDVRVSLAPQKVPRRLVVSFRVHSVVI